METKHGNLPDELLIVYLEKLVGSIYKILPLKESKSNTVEKYLDSLLRELIGNKELVKELKSNHDFLSILGVLQSLILEEEKVVYRSDVFKAINLINKIKSSLEGDTL